MCGTRVKEGKRLSTARPTGAGDFDFFHGSWHNANERRVAGGGGRHHMSMAGPSASIVTINRPSWFGAAQFYAT